MSAGSNPTYRVVEYVTNIKSAPPGPHANHTVADKLPTFADAEAEAQRRAKLFPVNGYNEEEDYWWGRNVSPSDNRFFYTAEASE